MIYNAPRKTHECPLILGTISSISIGNTSEPTIVFFQGIPVSFQGGVNQKYMDPY